MDPGSSAPSHPHPRSPADRFACTHPSAAAGHSRRTAGPSAPTQPGQAPTALRRNPAQLGFAPDSSCARWKRRVSSLLPSQHFSVSSWCCFPGMEQCPWGLGVCHACSGQPLGTEPAQPHGAQCPQAALSPVAPQRAQSIDHPTPSSMLGDPVHPALPAPSS